MKKIFTKERIEFIRRHKYLTNKELVLVFNAKITTIMDVKCTNKIKKNKSWTKDKIDFIKNNPHITNKELSKLFDVPNYTILNIKSVNKIKTRKFWDKEKIEFIRKNNYLTNKELGLVFNVTDLSIKKIKNKNKINMDIWWTKEQIEFIRNNQNLKDKELGLIFNTTKSAINNVKKRNKIVKEPKWTKRETEIIKKYYPNYDNESITKKINRTIHSIKDKAHFLGLTKSKERTAKIKNFFTKKEIDYLKKHYSTTINKKVAKILGRSENSINNIVNKKLKLYKDMTTIIKQKKKRENHWTKKEDEMIKNTNLLSTELSKIMDRTSSSIKTRKQRLGIKIDLKDRLRKLHRIQGKNNWKKKSFQEKMQKSLHLKPNKPETFLINLFKKHNLPYKYTGDYSLWIDGKNPDFVDVENKKIIEMFGIAYHNPEKAFIKVPYRKTEKGTIEHYKKHGYFAIIVWDTELRDEGSVLKKILDFHNKEMEAST